MKQKYILVALVIVVLFLAGCGTKAPVSGPATVTIYGLDNSNVFDPIISAYKERQPQVTIKYKKFVDRADFEELMVNEIAEGEGPDVFYIHNSWLPRHLKKIVPLNATDFTPDQFNEAYVNVVGDDFLQVDPSDGAKKIYALPLFVDTLALYYNKELFEQFIPERGKPGETWEAVKQDAVKFRKENGSLERGEIALGTAHTVSLAAEILYNYWIQASVPFYDEENKQVKIAGAGEKLFEDYLGFADRSSDSYSFGDELTSGSDLNEIEAFLNGKVAAIVGFSDVWGRLSNDLKNVKTRSNDTISLSDVSIAPIPQLSTDEKDFKAFASYYGLAVSRTSKNQKAAWDFIRFVGSKTASQMYVNKTKRPTARRDLIEGQKKDENLKVFASQLGFAASNHVFSYEKFGNYLRDALAKASGGQTRTSALNEAQTRMNEVLKRDAPNGIFEKPKVLKKK